MIKVVGVRFRTAGKIYFFDPGKLHIKKGQHVIVETARGVEYGYVLTGEREVTDDKVIQPLKPVLRIATNEDPRRCRNLRTAFVLPFLSVGVHSGIHQDGEGAESVPESHKNLRNLRQTDVLLKE